MPITITHRARFWAPAALLAALLALGVPTLLGNQPSRGSLLRSLQQPARYAATSVGPAPINTVISRPAYTVGLNMSPNRAGVRNGFSLRLTNGARPIIGARVTVTFSMPSMNMWQAYTSQLKAVGNGIYSAAEPVLGMPGLWQLSMHVARPGSRPFDVIVDDQMGS